MNTLVSQGAKGIIANIPDVTSIPHFTTVPHNPLDPSAPEFGDQIPTLNAVFGAINQIFIALNEPQRVIEFSTTEASPVVINDEDLSDLSAQIEGALLASPTFPAFIQQFGLPPQAAPLVANLLGNAYGQARQATENDLLVLTSSSIIGEENEQSVQALVSLGLSQELASQFSVEGVSLPLADRWVLIPSEQNDIQVATDAFNATIANMAMSNDLAFIDANALLVELSTSGLTFGDFTLTSNLVFGGAFSLDGVHLTTRGYGLVAYKMLEVIDDKYGSNFQASGNVPNPNNYPTNYPPGI